MDNTTVALSVVEDLIHWPLPPADPTASPASLTATTTTTTTTTTTINPASANMTDLEAPLSAGAVEELDEEPRERQRVRYDAVRRLPSLVRAMGSQWAKMEVVPYLLRCLEEEDAELSFATGMALIDLATGPAAAASQSHSVSSPPVCGISTERLFPDIARPLSLPKLLPVLLRMSASTDAGVRLFLLEVVIPTLFFGVSLERTVDLRDWESKYLTLRSCEEDETGAVGESRAAFDVHTAMGVHAAAVLSNNSRSSTFEHRRSDKSSSSGGVNSVVWDSFQINLYANRLRSAIATYLRDVAPESSESDGVSGPMMAMYGKAIGQGDYTDHRDRREAFRARWHLFVGLMESMLKSEYATTVSTGVECISNIFSCISWVMMAEQYQEIVPKTSLVRSIEELVSFTFTVTRSHVGRVIRSGAEKPCEDLMMLLFAHHLLIENSLSLSPSSSSSSSVGPVALGSGGLSPAAREVWDICLTGSMPVMHRLLRVSLLRSLPQLINWSSDVDIPGVETTTAGALLYGDPITGLSFFSVCHIFTQALTPPTNHIGQYERDVDDYQSYSESLDDKAESEDVDNNNNNNNNNKGLTGVAVASSTLFVFESDVCHDHGIAEAVIDGIQYLFDDLLHPHTVEVFMRPHHHRQRLQQLTKLYSECILRTVTLPSWRTRWLITQRLPQLTTRFMLVLSRLGSHRSAGMRMLVESTVVRLCTLHVEQWSPSHSGGDGCLNELVHDEEEEVRSVAALCAARVFCALGQGMVRLVFPNGVVADMKSQRRPTGEGDVTRRSTPPQVVESLGGRHMDLDTKGALQKDTMMNSQLGSTKKNNEGESHSDAILISVSTLIKHLPTLLDVILSSCLSLLRDPEERVRGGAAAGLSALARTLSSMITVCDLHVHDIGQSTWLQYLDSITASLMTLLNDNSPTVQLALVSELTALLTSNATGAGRLAATMGRQQVDRAAQAREDALVACLQSLARHEVWRYRARYATLLSEMCLKFLASSSLAAAEAVAPSRDQVHPLEVSLRDHSVTSGRPSGVLLAEDGVNPLHRFAKKELLPLLVDVLFDKVKAVRDSALESLQRMCDRLSAVRLQLMNASPGTDHSSHGISNSGGSSAFTGISGFGTSGNGRTRANSNMNTHCTNNSGSNRLKYHDDVFINDTLWPLIINSPKAMATYLSRSSLLRIAIRLGVDKESILLPLLDQLGHDAVLNVRLVVAKELHGILAASSTATVATAEVSGSSVPSWNGIPKVTFTAQEKNGVVLQLLRLLVEDKSADVRDEAAKALTLCF